jgi:hypothetical protein
MCVLADARIDCLKRKRQRIGQILAAQRQRRGDHLHGNRDKQTENSHDHRESDHGIDGI